MNTTDALKKDFNSFTVTFFSDVHHGDHNYNDFACTDGLKKLRTILKETQHSDFYINLGDICDYLKDGNIDFYHEISDVFSEFGIANADSANASAQRRVYNCMGNHEAAFIKKERLKQFIPYTEHAGSCFMFSYEGVLFIAIDASFDRKTGSDDPEILRTSTAFTLPESQTKYLLNMTEKYMNGHKSLVWISHIAFKDIDDSKWKLVEGLQKYNLPLTIFEGHTHIENYEKQCCKTNQSTIEIYTLPAVTSGRGYRYYNVSFSNGMIEAVYKHTEGIID